MSGELGHEGYVSRAPQPGDPVVCQACGITIGTRGGLESAEAKASAEAAHKPDCLKRVAHMQQHRTADPCPRCNPGAALDIDPPGRGGSVVTTPPPEER